MLLNSEVGIVFILIKLFILINYSIAWFLLQKVQKLVNLCILIPLYRGLSICTSNCKYEVIRRVAARFGMREVTEDSSWNLYWTDLSISVERAKDMKRFQKINHFPGMTELCRKDLLARNLNRMLKLFPQDYNFFPKTWCFPAE